MIRRLLTFFFLVAAFVFFLFGLASPEGSPEEMQMALWTVLAFLLAFFVNVDKIIRDVSKDGFFE